jgi:hypothetical protein
MLSLIGKCASLLANQTLKVFNLPLEKWVTVDVAGMISSRSCSV